MKGKLSTKTIIIAIVTIVLLAVATTGTVLFLKDSGEAEAMEENVLPVAGNDNEVGTSTEQTVENEGASSETSTEVEQTENESGEVTATTPSQTTGVLTEEPEATTVEQERVVSEKTTLGWNNLLVSAEEADYAGIEINYNNLKYTVEYYFDGEIDEKLTEVVDKNQKGKIIDTYTDKNKDGYKLDEVKNFPLTISENQTKNIIKIYYVKDNFEYTVNYYKDSIAEANFIEDEEGIAVFGSTITADTKIHIPTGYKFEGEAPSMVIAETGNVIEVIYVKNKYNYIVKHYYQGLNENEIFQDVINAPDETHEAYYGDTITEQDIAKKEITGYIYSTATTSESEEDTTLPLVVTENVDKNVISVYYIRNNFDYEIRYYQDSEDETNYITSETGSAMYGVIIPVDTTIHRPTGYTFEGEAPSMVIATTGNVIKVVYVKAKYEYKVEYYFDGNLDSNLTETKSEKYGTKIETYYDKVKTGYKLEKTENLPLIISEVITQNIIKVYYSKPNITIEKTVDATAKAGSELKYYIKLINSGKVSGTIDVTDELPDEVKYVLSTDKGNYTESEHTVVWSDITVDAGASKILEVVVKVNDNEIGTTISNTAKTSDNKTSTIEKKVSELKSTVKEYTEDEEIKDNVNIILVMDLSSSMNEKDAINENNRTDTRLNVAKTAAQDFIEDLYDNELNEHATVSVITFNTKNTEYWWGSPIPYTGTKQLGSTVTIDNYSSLVTAIGNIDIGDETTGYGTHIGAAMDETKNLINTLKTSYPKNKNIVIFLGDGKPTETYSNNSYAYITGVATTIKNGGADIYSIGFGNDITAGSTAEKVLKGISTSGNILKSTDAAGLSENFSNIAEQFINKEVTSSSGKMILTLGNTLLLDDKNTIIVEYKGTKLFECTKTEEMSKYFLEYNSDNKTLTWDINAWNNVEGNIKVVTDDINIVYYVEK